MKIVNIPKLSKELEIVPHRIDGDAMYVNYYSQGVQAGFPSPAEDMEERKLSLDQKYLTNPDATFVVRVKGASMLPTLNVGDLLIVKSDITFEDNLIGIVSVNNTDFTVKRLDKQKETLIADNPKFPNLKIEKEDTIICLGVVKHLIRDL